jgi:ABC-type xylose transport system permease subunit
MLVGQRYTLLRREQQRSVGILQTLFLFTTIFTFTSWMHCQQQHPNNLCNMLTASVVTLASGMLLDRIEQTVCICITAAIVVTFEIIFAPERGQQQPQRS